MMWVTDRMNRQTPRSKDLHKTGPARDEDVLGRVLDVAAGKGAVAAHVEALESIYW